MSQQRRGGRRAGKAGRTDGRWGRERERGEERRAELSPEFRGPFRRPGDVTRLAAGQLGPRREGPYVSPPEPASGQTPPRGEAGTTQGSRCRSPSFSSSPLDRRSAGRGRHLVSHSSSHTSLPGSPPSLRPESRRGEMKLSHFLRE